MAISFPEDRPHGGKRQNSGRKSDKRNRDFNRLFDRVVDPECLAGMIKKMVEAVEKDKDVSAFVALMNRRYGRVGPKEEGEAAVMVTLPGWFAPRPDAK